jgi:hypothetical protein
VFFHSPIANGVLNNEALVRTNKLLCNLRQWILRLWSGMRRTGVWSTNISEKPAYQIRERRISEKHYLNNLWSVQTRVGRSCCLGAKASSHLNYIHMCVCVCVCMCVCVWGKALDIFGRYLVWVFVAILTIIMRIPVAFLSPYRKFLLNLPHHHHRQAATDSFKIRSNLSLIHHPTIRCYILSVITIIANQPTKRQTYVILTPSSIKDMHRPFNADSSHQALNLFHSLWIHAIPSCCHCLLKYSEGMTDRQVSGQATEESLFYSGQV